MERKNGVRYLDSEFQKLDLIDLLSERYVMLKSVREEKWSEISDITVSNSEWYIMARIYKKQPTISYVTKNVHITRQATHKFIKRLESKGLVEITKANNNKRDKCIQLTELGELCFEKNIELKKEMEKKIAEKIGDNQLRALKKILKVDWGL